MQKKSKDLTPQKFSWKNDSVHASHEEAVERRDFLRLFEEEYEYFLKIKLLKAGFTVKVGTRLKED